MNLWKSYIKWRHFKGFGVHSPYAFGLVNMVVKPGEYGYYAYHEADNLLKGKEIDNPGLRKRVRFLIRLAIFLKTKRIFATGGNCRFAEVAARALHIPFRTTGSGQIKFEMTDLLIVSGERTYTGVSGKKDLKGGDDATAKVVASALGNNVAVFAYHPGPEVRKIMENPLAMGVLFHGGHSLLLIPRQEMQYVAYNIMFKIH